MTLDSIHSTICHDFLVKLLERKMGTVMGDEVGEELQKSIILVALLHKHSDFFINNHLVVSVLESIIREGSNITGTQTRTDPCKQVSV